MDRLRQMEMQTSWRILILQQFMFKKRVGADLRCRPSVQTFGAELRWRWRVRLSHHLVECQTVEARLEVQEPGVPDSGGQHLLEAQLEVQEPGVPDSGGQHLLEAQLEVQTWSWRSPYLKNTS